MSFFIITLALVCLIYSVLVGIAFYALKMRFNWAISPKQCFVILVILFALLENVELPMFMFLDITFTIGNEEVARMLEIMPDEPVINLYGLSLLNLVVWSIQALIAGYVGDKLFS